jgi:serine/threonine-protein kinase
VDKQRWKCINDLFQQAMELPPDTRRQFLTQACGDDGELFNLVLALLDNLNEGGEIEKLVRSAAHEVMEGERLATGTRLGPYAIVEEIGRGGMGAVYRAERADDLYQQTVAIKLVHGGRKDREHLERFGEERQILARLEHPHIARLLDGGTTESGVPYFVMEYVDGLPIDVYCNEHELSEPERLRLFLHICDAVQFAHQKLILHSDLKPSNVLLTQEGDVRLLDFGIARLLDVPGEEPSATTSEGWSRALTPLYSSPEQIRGDTVGTTSDVFALGVLLHDILTGQLPFDTPESSTLLGSSTPLQAQPVQVDASLSADIHSIVSKALQQEPTERYSSVAQLAEDIERYLGNYPVTARAGSWVYRARKFHLRNRISTIVATSLIFAVVVLATLTWIQSIEVAAERDLARVERDRAEGLSDFLIETLVSVTPNKAQGREITVREVLDNASAQLDLAENALDKQAVTQATLRRVIGAVYGRLGLPEPAEQNLTKALEFHQGSSQRDDEELFHVFAALYEVEHTKFDHEKSLAYLQEALLISQAVNGPDHPDTLETLKNIAGVHMMMGELDRAEAMHEEIYRRQVNLLGPDHPDTIGSLNSLGIVDQWQREYETARDKYQESLDKAIRVLGERDTRTLTYLSNYGSVLETMGDHQAALPVIERHVALATDVLGENHPATLRSMHNLADVYRGLGRYEESETLFVETLARRREHLGAKHIETLQTQFKLGRLYGLMGQQKEALALVTAAVEELSNQLGPDNPTTQIARQVLADLDKDSVQ